MANHTIESQPSATISDYMDVTHYFELKLRWILVCGYLSSLISATSMIKTSDCLGETDKFAEAEDLQSRMHRFGMSQGVILLIFLQ